MSFWGSEDSTRGGRKEHDEQLRALELRCDRLESAQKLLKIEWESTFDKMGRLMGRLNQRIRKNLDQEAALEAPGEPLEHPEGPRPLMHPTGSHGLLVGARTARKG